MDAAQMLTVQEIARQCEQLARTVQQREQLSEASGRHLRLAEPLTEPIARITDALPEQAAPEHDRVDPLPSDGELGEREWSILAFERQWWKSAGRKDQAIRELFDMSSSRYYQLLNALLDNPAAFRADPMLIKRLRKVRTSRQRGRSARDLGIELH
ncbi:uncharacterized protein DUF3263 [Saccharopolyspora erythraea NRRL 2338]|uniref:Uncharacterized protein n=2 Tax=Saccharopolyspora erythraea TaxID=1836 RepID=A4F737_SACEN|nr:hypothetical protein N599_28305 [Saccharopolyspora erythraea D]PFG93663.1 uncharacterized protein DUF3263 [Saccharopolyspora erythraea NRRL 2338]QRK90511.1 DUF3263 domain-containing protein [Saccharopolyspora erythraea]CAL99861.1 hypothetical protein SACE_0515 [Saccharopolyspora erythraea NRRL 2338]